MDDSHGADVLGRARAGDERAFLALYRAAQPGLLRYLAVLVGSDAQEVAARTWAEVNRDLASFTGGLDSFRSWVAGIGRRLAHERIDERSSGRAAGRPTRGPIDVADGPMPPQAAHALQLIAELPQAEAEAITLRAVMGMGEGEAAGVLGIGRQTLRRTAERGLRALVRRLEPRSGPSRVESAPPDVHRVAGDTADIDAIVVDRRRGDVDLDGIEVSR